MHNKRRWSGKPVYQRRRRQWEVAIYLDQWLIGFTCGELDMGRLWMANLFLLNIRISYYSRDVQKEQ